MKRINRTWHMQTSHTDPSDRCKTCALTCSSDLFLRSPRDVKVICFSIWITHNRDVMHSPLCRRMNDHSAVLFVNSEMDPSAFCPLSFLHSLILFSLVYELSILPCPSFKPRHTRTHRTNSKSDVCWLQYADCLLKREIWWKKKKMNLKSLPSIICIHFGHVDTYIFIKSQRKMSISRCTWALNSKY